MVSPFESTTSRLSTSSTMSARSGELPRGSLFILVLEPGAFSDLDRFQHSPIFLSSDY